MTVMVRCLMYHKTSLKTKVSAITCEVGYLQISRQGDVDLLPVRSDSVQKEGVVHGAVPGCVEAVEGSASSKR